MKKLFLFATAAALMVGCSSNDLVDSSRNGDLRANGEVPIEFNVQKQNITRGTNLESVKHYNFGVWAWKVQGKNSLADMEVMNHYLVGYGGTNVGYDHSKATTYASVPGNIKDHKSPWFYESLGYDEYTYNNSSSGLYYVNNLASTSPMAWVDYKSVKDKQYLRYWDLAYNKTNFYCYAPYNAQVTFNHVDDGTSTMTFPATNSIRDGYDLPQNTAYNAYSRTLGEFMYAGVQATNANLSDVTVPFKHMGAQLFIRFYESVPGYRVEIIDLCADNGKAKTGLSEDQKKGIQATPAVASGTVTFYTEAEAIAHNKTLEGAWTTSTVKTPAVNYTQEECDAYNIANNLTVGDEGYRTTSTVKTPAVYYTEAEANAHNLTLPGAV